jgi:hypothetical protein
MGGMTIMNMQKKGFFIIAAVLWGIAIALGCYTFFFSSSGSFTYLAGFFGTGFAMGIALTQTYDAFRISSFAGKVYREKDGVLVEVNI